MDFALFIASLLFYRFGHPASALLLRCGLEACLFSARASLSLAAFSALTGAAAGLLCRGGLHAVPYAQRMAAAFAGFTGGTLGRAALLILTARIPDTLFLSRLQALPLLLLALFPLRRPEAKAQLPWATPKLFLFSQLCGTIDGFLGAGGTALFMTAALGGVSRGESIPSFALLMTICAQGGAILATILCQEAQHFPGRMLALLAMGSAAGAILSEKQKERGALHRGMRIALMAYLILSALSCMEQAL